MRRPALPTSFLAPMRACAQSFAASVEHHVTTMDVQVSGSPNAILVFVTGELKVRRVRGGEPDRDPHLVVRAARSMAAPL